MAKQSISKECSIDTNILLRWILGDNQDQADRVDKLLTNSNLRKVHISDIVFAEIVWVMQSVYELNRKEISEAIKIVLSHPKFVCNRVLFERTLPDYLEHSSISFTDIMLYNYALINNSLPLYTFDKKLANRFSEIAEL